MLSKKFFSGFAYVFNIIYFLVCMPFSLCLFDVRDAVFNLLLPLGVIFLLPLVFFGYVFIKKKEAHVSKFFFGLEMPLLLLSVFRICLLRELTPFYFLLLSGIFACVVLFSLELFDKKFEFIDKIAVFVYEIPVIIGGYFSFLAMFAVIPFAIMFLKFIFSHDFIKIICGIFELIIDFIKNFSFSDLLAMIYISLFLIFLALFALIFVITPLTSVVIYFKEFISRYKNFEKKSYCAVFAILFILILGLSSLHFSSLDFSKDYWKIANAKTYSDITQQAFSQNKIKRFLIKKSYLDNYLASQRYIFDNTDNSIQSLWKEAVNNDTVSITAQILFNKVAYPFYFDGKFGVNEINEKFSEFFDEDIQLLMKNEIKKSINSTFFDKSETATTLDIDSKDVFVNKRTITIDETNTENIYKVVFEEEYQNQTESEKEVYYEFSLPQNAVITDLKLGNNLQYQGELAPKGSARKTYLAQTAKRKDPALLEKNGIVQYTLRVYPIPSNDSSQEQKVQFTYYISSKNDSITLPAFSQARNADFNNRSKYSAFLKGNRIKLDKKQKIVNLKSSTIDELQVKEPQNPENKKIALLLDTSYSNKIIWKDYLKSDSNFKTLINKNKVDYYFFNKFLSEKMDNIDNAKQINFSKSAKYDAYCSLDNSYDMVFLLSDESVYDSSLYKPCTNKMPLYIIHAGSEGKIPPYNNALSNLIYKTNGNIANTLEEALDSSVPYFGISSVNNSNISPETKAFNASFEVDKLLRKDIEKIDNSNALKEKIYNIAQAGNIVTKYSSLISLVTQAQQIELEHNNTKKDKFDADLSTGEQEGFEKTQFKKAQDKTAEDVKSVPEPQDYILIILMVLMCAVFYKRNICEKIR